MRLMLLGSRAVPFDIVEEKRKYERVSDQLVNELSS